MSASLLVGAVAEAQDLGRLFFAPEERAILEEARRDMDLGTEPRPGGEETRPVRGVTQLTFGGSVVRGNGETTTWINGQRVLPGDATREGIRVAPTGRPGGEVRITLPSGVGSIELRAGQSIEVVSGRVVDAFESGQRERPARAESDIELDDGGDPGSTPEAPPASRPAPPAPGRTPSVEPGTGGS